MPDPLRRVACVVLCAVLSALATGCGCDAYAAPGLVVQARAAESGARLVAADDVVVTATRSDAQLVESRSASELGVANLLYEKTGTFEVTVTARGRQTWRRAPVRLFSDGCHVKTRNFTADLSR